MKNRIASLLVIIAAIGLLGAIVVSAQQPQPPQSPSGRPEMPPPPPMEEAMFPPELIMQHQRELSLTDEQKTFMRSEIQRTTTRFNELQWQLQDAMESLHETMKGNSVNEQLALSQLDKVLDGEREIKRLHMELAIRIKNKLTKEQQDKLHTMRHEMGGGPGGPGHRPGGPGGPGMGGPGRGPGGPGPGPGRGPGRPGGPGGSGGAPPPPRPNDDQID
jgi:Spy/CpxP family protein refolding chaperone